MRTVRGLGRTATRAAFALGLAASVNVVGGSHASAQTEQPELQLEFVGTWLIDPAGSQDLLAAENVLPAFAEKPRLDVSSENVSFVGSVWLTSRLEGCLSQTRFALDASTVPPAPFDPLAPLDLTLTGDLRVSNGPFDTCAQPVGPAEPTSELTMTVRLADDVATVVSAVAAGTDFAPNLGPLRPPGTVSGDSAGYYGFWDPIQGSTGGTFFEAADVAALQWFSTSIVGDRFTATSAVRTTASRADCELRGIVEFHLAGAGGGATPREIAFGGTATSSRDTDNTCDAALGEEWIWGTAVIEAETIRVTSLPAFGVDYAPHIGTLLRIDIPTDEPMPLLIGPEPLLQTEIAPDPAVEQPEGQPITGDSNAETAQRDTTADSDSVFSKIWRVVSIVAAVLSVAMIVLALWMARRESRIRPVLEMFRLVLMVGVAVVMTIVFSGTVNPAAVGGAAGVGLVLGWYQGSNLTIRMTDRGAVAQRNTLAVIVFAFGLLVVQVAGLAQRQGVITLGVALTALSAGVLVGTIFGRRKPTTIAAGQMAGLAIVALALGTPPSTDPPTTEPFVNAPTEFEGVYEGTGGSFADSTDDLIFGLGASIELAVPQQAVAVDGSLVYTELLFDFGFGIDEDCFGKVQFFLEASGRLDPTVVGAQSSDVIGRFGVNSVGGTCPSTQSTAVFGLFAGQVALREGEAEITYVSFADSDSDFGPLIGSVLYGNPMGVTDSDAPDLEGRISELPSPGRSFTPIPSDDPESGTGDGSDVSEQAPDGTGGEAETAEEALADLLADDDLNDEQRAATVAAIAAIIGALGVGAVSAVDAGVSLGELATSAAEARSDLPGRDADAVLEPRADDGQFDSIEPPGDPGHFEEVEQGEFEPLLLDTGAPPPPSVFETGSELARRAQELLGDVGTTALDGIRPVVDMANELRDRLAAADRAMLENTLTGLRHASAAAMDVSSRIGEEVAALDIGVESTAREGVLRARQALDNLGPSLFDAGNRLVEADETFQQAMNTGFNQFDAALYAGVEGLGSLIRGQMQTTAEMYATEAQRGLEMTADVAQQIGAAMVDSSTRSAQNYAAMFQRSAATGIDGLNTVYDAAQDLNATIDEARERLGGSVRETIRNAADNGVPGAQTAQDLQAYSDAVDEFVGAQVDRVTSGLRDAVTSASNLDTEISEAGSAFMERVDARLGDAADHINDLGDGAHQLAADLASMTEETPDPYAGLDPYSPEYDAVMRAEFDAFDAEIEAATGPGVLTSRMEPEPFSEEAIARTRAEFEAFDREVFGDQPPTPRGPNSGLTAPPPDPLDGLTPDTPEYDAAIQQQIDDARAEYEAFDREVFGDQPPTPRGPNSGLTAPDSATADFPGEDWGTLAEQRVNSMYEDFSEWWNAEPEPKPIATRSRQFQVRTSATLA